MDVETEPHAVEQIVQEAVEEQVETQEQDFDIDDDQSNESQEVRQVPLSALQKERRKTQEAKAESHRAAIELQFYREQQNKKIAEPEDNSDDYESVTKREHSNSIKSTRDEIMRDVEERMWIKSNPEKAQFVDENLTDLLNKKPNLTGAIKDASNRYEEAYLLLNALTPKQQTQLKPKVKVKVAPGSPSAVPKGASLNQVTDVMQMSDKEYQDWRSSKKIRR